MIVAFIFFALGIIVGLAAFKVLLLPFTETSTYTISAEICFGTEGGGREVLAWSWLHKCRFTVDPSTLHALHLLDQRCLSHCLETLNTKFDLRGYQMIPDFSLL